MFTPATVRWFVLAALFIYVTALILPTVIHIWSLRLRAPELIPQATLSPAHQQILAPTVRALAEVGFGWPQPVRLNNITLEYAFGYLLYRPVSNTIALVTAPPIPTEQVTANVTYFTFFENDAVLATFQGLGLGAVPTPANILTEYVPTRSPSATWDAHDAARQKLLATSSPRPCQPDNCLHQVNNHYHARLIPHLLATGTLVAEEGQVDHFHFQWRETVRQSWQILRGRRGLRQVSQIARAEALPAPFNYDDLPVEMEVEAFERSQQRRRRRATLWGRLALIVGSLALFYISFLQLFPLAPDPLPAAGAHHS